MRRLNCRPGELAIAVNSFDPANIGSIVKVLGRDAKACDKKFFWRTHAAHTLNYAKGDKQYRRRKGSLADADLQPIRGYPLGIDPAICVNEQMAPRWGWGRNSLRQVCPLRCSHSTRCELQGRCYSISLLFDFAVTRS